jgi:hypothetical protein
LKFVAIEMPLLMTSGFYEQIMSMGWVDFRIKGTGGAGLINEADILN